MKIEGAAPWLVAIVVATTIVVLLATGDPLLASLPLVVVLFAVLCARAPMQWLGIGLFFLAVVVDNPKEHPAQGEWNSPLYPIGLALYENLNSLTGVAPLRFALMDVLLVGLLVVVAWRRGAGREAIALPKPVHLALATMLGAWLLVEAYGLARGGDFKSSLWQLRPPIWVPVMAWIFAGTLRDGRDLRPLGGAVVLAALIKTAMGAYYWFFLCRPRMVRPEYVTTHSDSVLFVAAIVVALVAMLERPTRATILASFGAIAVVGFGVVINARRLAYIELAGCLVAVYLLLPDAALRARVHRTLAWSAAPTAAYLALGWRSGSTIFAPAAKVASLFSEEDRSSGTRDVENYNLIMAWKKNLLIGSGLGHEYEEFSKGDSIERFFALYRYIGHDGVLWLFSVAGLVGFAMVWTPVVVCAYFAARAHRFATTTLDRAGALVSLCVVVCYIVQAYGDIGLQSWTGTFFFAAAIAVSGKLAVSTGAWPGRETSTFPFPRVVTQTALARRAA